MSLLDNESDLLNDVTIDVPYLLEKIKELQVEMHDLKLERERTEIELNRLKYNACQEVRNLREEIHYISELIRNQKHI